MSVLIFAEHLETISTLFYFAVLILHALAISVVVNTTVKEAHTEELEPHFNIRLSWQRSQFGALLSGSHGSSPQGSLDKHSNFVSINRTGL